MRFKNFVNNFSKRNRIFSDEDMYNMSLGNMFDNEDELYSQYKSIGFPTKNELETSPNVQWVELYTNQEGQKDGGFWQSILQQEYQNPITENTQQSPLINSQNSLPRHTFMGQPLGPIIQEVSPEQTVRKYLTEPNKEINNPQQVQQEQSPLLQEIQKQTQVPELQETITKDENIKQDNGSITGGAANIDKSEGTENINDLPKNNDTFFEKERQNPQSILMRYNADKNENRPEAKLFMDIALVGPKNVPSTQDYQFISSKRNKEINEKYNLTGNKEIPNHYDGFEFSADSPTAQALNSSKEFKNQILSPKNYDSTTCTFTRDKLEIEFKDDTNLQYSFGHMTVLNPKIENGYITGVVYDKYNYETMYGKKFENIPREAKSLNNKAKFLQATSKLKNYYVLVPVKIKI